MYSLVVSIYVSGIRVTVSNQYLLFLVIVRFRLKLAFDHDRDWYLDWITVLLAVRFELEALAAGRLCSNLAFALELLAVASGNEMIRAWAALGAEPCGLYCRAASSQS